MRQDTGTIVIAVALEKHRNLIHVAYCGMDAHAILAETRRTGVAEGRRGTRRRQEVNRGRSTSIG
jgi:hypothetical protein